MKRNVYILSILLVIVLIFGCNNGLLDEQDKNSSSERTDVEIISSNYSDGAIIIFYTEPEESGFSSVEMTFTPGAAGVTQPAKIKAGESYYIEPICIASLTELSNETEYTITLKACYRDGTKSDGVSVIITPHAGVASPQNFTASEGIGSIALSWGAPAGNNWFNLELTFTPDEPSIDQPIVLAADDVGCTIEGLTEGVEYSFSLKAVEYFGDESTPANAMATPRAAVVPPTVNAVSLSFRDKDFDDDEISGTCIIGISADESNIETYKLYWGQSATEKQNATAFAEVDKTGADIEYVIPGNTAPPVGTTHILIYSSNSTGDCGAPIAAILEDFVVTKEPYRGYMSDIIKLDTNYYVTFPPDTDIFKWNGSDFIAETIIDQTWGDTPSSMTVFGDRIMFIAEDDAGNNARLWEYFPATSTARRVSDAAESCRYDNIVYDGIFYFVMYDSTIGYCIYSYDDAGNVTLVFDPDADSQNQSARILCVYHDELLIIGYDAGNETRLYTYNGTTTVPVSLLPVGSIIVPWNLALNNGILYFSVSDESGGNNLYSYNGSSVELAADLKSSGNLIGIADNINTLAAFNGNIFMSAGNEADGCELWRYDGISASMIHDFDTIGTGILNSGGAPQGFKEFNGYLFMGAYLEGNGHQLYLYDVNGNIIPIIDVNPVYNAAEPDITFPIAIFESDLIFTNYLGSNWEYWRLSINGF